MPNDNENQEEVLVDVVAEPVAEEVEEPKKPVTRKKVNVDVMPENLFSDFYVVVTADGYPEAYLVSKQDHSLAPGRQKIESQVLERAPKAHDFGPALSALMPTVESTLRAFYRAGIVDISTLKQGQRYRNALVRAMPRLDHIQAASES